MRLPGQKLTNRLRLGRVRVVMFLEAVDETRDDELPGVVTVAHHHDQAFVLHRHVIQTREINRYTCDI